MNDDRDPVDLLAEDFADRLRRGERPSVSEYAVKHPEHADQIRQVLPAVAQMEQLKNFRRSTPAVNSENLPDRLGDFRIVRELGRGGMGVVFEAMQESLGRRVALKVLASHAQLDPERRERFVREAKAAARLHHTNIVPVFGVGEQDGLPYYVMQLIPGHGLNALVNQWKDLAQGETRAVARRGDSTVVSSGKKKPKQEPKTQPPLPANGLAPDDWSLIASIGAQTAQALQYAHHMGVLHRDVKPANLLLDDRGEVWVVDFGLAKLANYRGLTATGHIVGTLQYLAPECLNGKADARSDVYGLGATLYELLTLASPFEGESPAQIMKLIADSSVIPPRKLNPNIPRDLETIVLKAMDRDPGRRYSSARLMAEDLEAFLGDRPIRARRESAPERAWRWARQHPAVASLSCCTFAALSLAATIGWIGYDRTNRALTEAKTQRDEAVTSSAKLKANLALSLEAFEKVFVAAGGDDFRPGPMPMRPPGGGGPEGGFPGGNPFNNDSANKAAVLEAVLTFYDRFAEQNQTDAQLRFDAAKAYRRVGEMHLSLKRNEKGAVAFRRAFDLLESMPPERKAEPDVRYELMQWYATAPMGANGAEPQLIQAAALGEGFLAAPRRWSVGTVYFKLGWAREQAKNLKGAEEAYRRAAELYRARPEEQDPPPNVHSERSRTQFRLAAVLAESNRPDESREVLDKLAEEMRSQMGGGGPHGRFVKETLSEVLFQLSEWHQRAGDEANATRLRSESQRLLEAFGGPFGGGKGPFPKGPPPKK